MAVLAGEPWCYRPWEVRRLTRRWVYQVLFHPRDRFGVVRPDQSRDGSKPPTWRDFLWEQGWPAWKIPAKLREMTTGRRTR